ncbi:hypothetical protein GGQ82_000083 [Sphingobium olei]
MENRDFLLRYCVMIAAITCGCFAILSGRRAFSRDDGARKGDALAAFGTAAELGIGAARRVRAIARGFPQVFFPNRVTDADDHRSASPV